MAIEAKSYAQLQLMMLYLHSKQTEAWCQDILDETKVIQEFKFRVTELRNSSRMMNNYAEKIMGADDYETSAEISDSLYRMAKMPSEKIDELSEIMKTFINGVLGAEK